MSILIKGMEMPQNCNECDLSRRQHSSMGDIIDCKRIGTVGSAFNDPYMILIVRHPNCPLAEIKEPHGRLIDGDKFYKVMCSHWVLSLGEAYKRLEEFLEKPVIEAEGSET